jgi:predicted O-linked N-acetylglucosamine transferase (SPINDLY family)
MDRADPLPTPSQVDAGFRRALQLHQSGQLAEAERFYEQVLRSRPDHFDALHLLGLVAAQTGRPERAVTLIDRAIRINPDFAAAHANRAKTLNDLSRHAEALASCLQALRCDPGSVGAYINQGNALDALGRSEEAVASYDHALRLDPHSGEALADRANALQRLGRHLEAVADYGRAISLNNNHCAAYVGRGVALQALKRPRQALLDFQSALQINPTHPEAYSNLGNLLVEQKRLDEAVVAFSKALAINPAIPFVYGTLLHTRMKICDWARLEPQVASLAATIEQNRSASPPFPLVSIPTTAALQKKAAEIWVDAVCPAKDSYDVELKRDERIRLGYFSSDFHNHATAWLAAGLFEAHDRRRFEVHAFSFGSPPRDAMNRRVESAFDRFTDVSLISDRSIAHLARNAGIDIAVDLKGFTTGCRTNIFAHRAAPIQVNFLGYPGSMGASYIDYIIADRVVIPESEFSNYSEKVVHLPHSYQVNDSAREISNRSMTRAAAGLPEQGVVFCCFNNTYKLNPGVFDCWMRILRRVEGSVLWLLSDNRSSRLNLMREAELRGVAPERLVFAGRMALEDHLARHRLADLCLDTWPCNAHTTASDALWAGLPVLTLLGQTFAGRVAASLLNALDIDELVTHSLEAYEELAVTLGDSPARLNILKEKLRARTPTAPLFDTTLFCAHLEDAYAMMVSRRDAGLPPDHIRVPPR